MVDDPATVVKCDNARVRGVGVQLVRCQSDVNGPMICQI